MQGLQDGEDDWKKIWCDKYDVNGNDNFDEKDGSHEIFSDVKKNKLISLG